MSTVLVKDVAEGGLASIALVMAWLGVLSTVLTIVATALTILWSCIRIAETEWWNNLRAKWRNR